MTRLGRRLLRANTAVLVGLFALQAVCYSYFFTALIFTNHTFPNSLPFAYPSFKTTIEGRWLADLLILLQGRSGVQPVMMLASAVVQAVNGVLLGRLLRLRGCWHVFLTGAVLCLFPAFVDYYSFAGDNLGFVFGDAFVLLGTLVFVRGRRVLVRLAGTSTLYALALACYQPKIALVCVLAVVGALLRLLERPDDRSRRSGPAILDCAGVMAATIAAAVAMYWVSLRLSIVELGGVRTHANSLPEMVAAIPAAYRWFWPAMTSDLGGMPGLVAALPAAGMIWGMLLLAGSLFRRSALYGLVAMGLLAVIPAALDADRIVNSLTKDDLGRITSACGYCLALFLGFGLRSPLGKYPCGTALAVAAYFFAVLAMQTTNAVMLKTIYDIGNINRLVARVERVVAGPAPQGRAVVIVGNFPRFRMEKFVRHPTRAHAAHVFTDSFAEYRQPQILNFFMGSDTWRPPTGEELERAIATMPGRHAWPQEESVYFADDTLVVLLEGYRPGVLLTQPTP